MEFNLICSGMGLTALTFRQGYVDLLEELVNRGKRYDSKGEKIFFCDVISPGVFVFGAIFGEDAFLLFPFYDVELKLHVFLKRIFVSDIEKSMLIAEFAFFESHAAINGLKIYAALAFPYWLADKTDIFYAGAKQTTIECAVPLTVTLNAFLILETAVLYNDKADYFKKYGNEIVIDEKTIVWLKNINKDETDYKNMPYAHFTGIVKAAYKVLNEYTKEYFRRIVVFSNGIEFSVLAPYSSKNEPDPLKSLKKDSILEGDIYFTAKRC
ncbi:MAG: hypothetical protein QMC67_07845 [Candidatus Wallbacteria bacterium]